MWKTFQLANRAKTELFWQSNILRDGLKNNNRHAQDVSEFSTRGRECKKLSCTAGFLLKYMRVYFCRILFCEFHKQAFHAAVHYHAVFIKLDAVFIRQTFLYPLDEKAAQPHRVKRCYKLYIILTDATGLLIG